MSERTTVISADQLSQIPETHIIDPLVQCGVLYLGSAPPSPGRRGLDSVQEPFSRRYPIDGTNTVRGIDAVLSVYDNGIQIAFARHPHAVIFYPISSLVYCASLRFSIVESDLVSGIDWRFITLDSTVESNSKHPPLFCAVVQRTQIIPGDECHCFITKSDDAALALVRTISEVYAHLKPNCKNLKSPIFYQLDRYGRKISETTGIVYTTPATDEDSKKSDRYGTISKRTRTYLLDPTSDGFFYRTDSSIIEQWQLWDSNDLSESRPRPPASPFGQHQGLYHDDLTHEIHDQLRHMDEEESSHSSTCSCSSSSKSSLDYEEYPHHHQDSKDESDLFSTTNSNPQVSAFDPTLVTPSPSTHNTTQSQPIIIEKVIPYPMTHMPGASTQYYSAQAQAPYQYTMPSDESSISYAPLSTAYHVNERGEKVTEEGNRILYMDVYRPDPNNPKDEPHPFTTQSLHRRLNRRKSNTIPVVDIQSLEHIFADNRISQQEQPQQSQTTINPREKKSKRSRRLPSDSVEIVEEYFEDHKGRRIQLNSYDSETILKYLESSNKQKHGQSNGSVYETSRRHRQDQSTLVAGPSINYVERALMFPDKRNTTIELPPPPQQQPLQQEKQLPPEQPVFNSEKVNDYVSNIYGLSQRANPSIKSARSSSHHRETKPPDNGNTSQALIEGEDFISPFRYMQSSINPLLLREYRRAFTGN